MTPRCTTVQTDPEIYNIDFDIADFGICTQIFREHSRQGKQILPPFCIKHSSLCKAVALCSGGVQSLDLAHRGAIFEKDVLQLIAEGKRWKQPLWVKSHVCSELKMYLSFIKKIIGINEPGSIITW